MHTNQTLKAIFDRTEGHCHFCGDSLIWAKYAWKDVNDLDGAWEVDHIIQKGKGGAKDARNCLPACVRCNRLRWHRKGNDIRELLVLGLIAKDQIKAKSGIGARLLEFMKLRRERNLKRRRTPLSEGATDSA